MGSSSSSKEFLPLAPSWLGIGSEREYFYCCGISWVGLFDLGLETPGQNYSNYPATLDRRATWKVALEALEAWVATLKDLRLKSMPWWSVRILEELKKVCFRWLVPLLASAAKPHDIGT